MSSVIILQRVVPPYRVAIFERLHELFGWRVACHESSFDQRVESNPDVKRFVVPFKFDLSWARNRIQSIPVSEILRTTGAKAVISEFSLKMTSTYELTARRRLLGGPLTVFWSHGYNMHRGLASTPQRMAQVPRILLSKLADAHLCYSSEGYDFLARHMSPNRLFIARNTIDVASMREMASQIRCVPETRGPRLLTVGRTVPSKNFPMLVRVFKRFRETYPDATLTIIGDGPDADRTRAVAGSDLGGAIKMIGREYDEEKLARHFSSADLLVMSGGVGLAANHALAYGVPVVAFDRTPIGPAHGPEIEYVKDFVTGYRVPEYSEEALLKALQMFFAKYPDPKKGLEQSIRHYVDDNILLEHMVEGFAQVHGFLRERGVS